ncbi:MAG: hypothetical protein LBD46_03735 [Endomicrobium sp.]|jgi:murein L,D-transpeptidase YafK|nr:hypothetical protein [Endomicrobium sp.]
MFNSNAFAQIPFSLRVKKTVARIMPILEKEFRNKKLKFGADVFVRILKEEYILEVWVNDGRQYSLLKEYPVLFGRTWYEN